MPFLSDESTSSGPLKNKVFLVVVGTLSGIAAAMNSIASSGKSPTILSLLGILFLSALSGAVLFPVLRMFLVRIANGIGTSELALKRYEEASAWPFLIFLLSFLGAFGVQFNFISTGILWCFFLFAQWHCLNRCTDGLIGRNLFQSRSTLAALFMLSGVAALIYQVVWQRLLFTLFGVNIESVTLIVSIFMFGLGVGAIAGGWLSDKFSKTLPELFLWIEIGIAIFGFASVPLIYYVGEAASGLNTSGIAAVVYLLLFFPTLCMGATLPILVAYLHRGNAKLGSSVGLLYTFNTAGSALACFLTAGVLFRFLGLTGSVWFAACCNLMTGLLVFIYCKKNSHKDNPNPTN